MKINQIKAGIIVSYVSQFIHILTGLIYTPIMLRLLGQNEFGLYQLIYSIVSYLGLLSLGFGSAYMRFYSRKKAENNEEGIAKLNGLFFIIFNLITIISIICGIFLITNIRSILNENLTYQEFKTAKVLMILMLIDVALTFINTVFNCIVTSQEKFLFQKSLILLQYLLNPFLTIPLLITGYGSIGMAMISTLLTFSVLMLNIYYCIVKLHAKFIFKGFEFGLLKEIWFFTFFIFLNQIIDQINLNIDKFLLGRIIGTTSVAIYGVGSQINNLYMQLSSSVSNVFIPKVNMAIAENRINDEITSIFIKVGRIQFLIISLIFFGFAFWGEQFIKLWAGNDYYDSYLVALILMLPVSVPLIQNIGIEIQRAKNKHKARSIVYFLIAIANIAISIPLITLWGPIGATLGTAISLVIGNILFMNWYYYKKLDIDIPKFWKSISQFIPGLIIPSFYAIVVTNYFSYSGKLIFTLQLVIYTVLFFVSMYFISMNNYEKKHIRSILNKIFFHKGINV